MIFKLKVSFLESRDCFSGHVTGLNLTYKFLVRWPS